MFQHNLCASTFYLRKLDDNYTPFALRRVISRTTWKMLHHNLCEATFYQCKLDDTAHPPLHERPGKCTIIIFVQLIDPENDNLLVNRRWKLARGVYSRVAIKLWLTVESPKTICLRKFGHMILSELVWTTQKEDNIIKQASAQEPV
jgi:hypothetical protein